MKYGKRGLLEEFSGRDQIGQTANREGRLDIEGAGNFRERTACRGALFLYISQDV